MKMLKKLFAFVAAFAMLLALPTTVLAEGDETPTTYTITAPNDNHVYEIYQIFTGDYSGGVLSNIKWGVNGTGYDASKTEQDKVSTDIITVLENVKNSSDKEKLAVITQYVTKNIEGKLVNPIATISSDATNAANDTYQATGGYYLIKDKDGSVSGTDAYTTYVVRVIGGFTITPKSDVPTFKKKVKDTNDSTGETSDWQDSADYDINDKVPFQLTGTVASNYADYSTYYFAFHDVEETGLTFEGISSVYVQNGDTKTIIDPSAYELVKNTDKTSDGNARITDGCTFEIVFKNLKEITAVTGGSKIVVEYTSTLNDKAVVGNQGNVNKAKLEFSNNPNQEQSGTDKPSTGETPWDNVIVFTYQTVINKVDQNNQALKGAKFTLKKVKVDENGNPTEEVVKTYTYSEEDDTTTFTFKGLDDGTYKLEETETPSGYNTIEPIVFTVNAVHSINNWDGTNRTYVLTSLNGTKVTGEITLTPSADKGTLTTNVVNKKGTILPSTGGIGTTVFYVTGAILMLGAGVLLVSRKRVSK